MAEGGLAEIPQFQRFPSVIRSISVDETGRQKDHKLVDKHGKFLVRGLEKVRRNSAHLDITLVIGKKRIVAHKVILAAFSPYFEALLSPNMMEGKQNEIELHELNGPVVEKLVDFAYTGKISYTDDSVQDLLETANFLDITLVRHDCAKYIAMQLDSQNVSDIYILGRQIGEEVMYKSAVNYCLDNFMMFSKTQEFLTMPVEMVEEVLRNDNLQCFDPHAVPIPANIESHILKAVLLYVSHDKASRLKLLPGYLKTTRLPQLLRGVLTDLKNNDLVKESEESMALVDKAIQLGHENFEDDGEIIGLWAEPRKTNLLNKWSREFGGVYQIRALEHYDDRERVSAPAYLIGMKIWLRRWDGRPVWGGYEVTYSNGTTLHHGAKDLNYEFFEFRLNEGEVITALDVNSGWLIDQVTFHTSTGRDLGPYGGPGGGEHHIRHPGRDENGGFLGATKGSIADTQNCLAISSLQFQWLYFGHKEGDKNVRCYSDIDSGEELALEYYGDDDDDDDDDRVSEEIESDE